MTLIGGVMEHIEEAGVHSGDSACSLPPYSLPPQVVDEIKQATYALARELQVRGLMNIQFAVKTVDGRHTVYVLEVNPRASRTSPSSRRRPDGRWRRSPPRSWPACRWPSRA